MLLKKPRGRELRSPSTSVMKEYCENVAYSIAPNTNITSQPLGKMELFLGYGINDRCCNIRVGYDYCLNGQEDASEYGCIRPGNVLLM